MRSGPVFYHSGTNIDRSRSRSKPFEAIDRDRTGLLNTIGAGAGKFCGLVLYPGKKEGNRSSLVEKFREGIKNFVSFLLVHE